MVSLKLIPVWDERDEVEDIQGWIPGHHWTHTHT